jgi:hypothetical protein
MQDRDSFHHRASRTRIGDARRAQHDGNDPLLETLKESVATDGKEPKALDLDNPEQRRRFMEGLAAEREAKIDRQKRLDELEGDPAAASIPIDRLNASNDD